MMLADFDEFRRTYGIDIVPSSTILSQIKKKSKKEKIQAFSRTLNQQIK